MDYFHPRAPEKSPDGSKFGLVTFVDILGFSSASKGCSREVVRNLLRWSRRSVSKSALASFGAPTLPREFIAFQDSMVRCTEIGWMRDDLPGADEAHQLGNWVSAIMDEFASLRAIQLNCIAKGHLLREAIAVGLFETGEGAVWGTAYERAVQFESSVAVYPRIVIDDFLHGFMEYVKGANLVWLIENMRTDQEGATYIDHLRGIAFECSNDMSAFASQLAIHRDFIRSSLRDYDDPTALDKLAWLGEYNDASVRDLASRRPNTLEWTSYLINGAT